ncbi:Pre-mRNA cleavage complex ii protein clp1 [Lasiodiplodia theobromae]|uniref:Polynucleotide 5'-hydroxyl-kinase GRC3 n=2 Tax=Lasiodiplodia theobromae TaxID=45133 RepID=A0A5N5DTE3_9PEZI|nr:Pre-mRNA cleavage complex ii protein clp1 [Lasiodiplodia theobromae]KAB2581255.1 mRNA cleavage and polyadenylation factor CLP1 [Lasiodiplodia theobromae]KAF4541690.1 Pre-mRNA cleavage complex ii protein clp1 [Lasiodiplodia theobromae]
MSLPGLSLPGLSMSAAPPPSAADVLAPSSAPRTQDLAPGTEYRFEVPFNATLTVKLLNGTAECFGTELACNAKEPYLFRAGTKAAIFTWHGCRLQVEGDVESEYQAEETPMVEYANVHFALERLRDAVSTTQEMGSGGEKPIGPRVLVVGPENAGKTSLVRLLTAYGVKMGRQPVVVNLDPRQGMLSPPGSLATATMASVLDVEEGWGSSPINGPSPVPVKMPLVYHFGLGSPDDNPKMYRGLVTRLALAVTSRLGEDDEARKSGCIIDTPGVLSVDKKGVYENIQHVVSEFSVNVILVLGSERLYSDLSRRFSRPGEDPVQVVKLDKSGGCVDRDETYMKALRQTQVRSYFFGHGSTTLSPHTQRLDFNSLHIFRTVDTSATNPASSFLPGGEDDDTESSGRLYDRIKPSLMIQNGLLAITHAEPSDSYEHIRDSSVVGYVYIADVDEAKQNVKLLAPLSGQIPRSAMILGNWPEDVAGLVG